jgi:acyl-[acyl-carrier-protein]-phospholipid O-acyltransferase/long-chain-fatty-acid--[acyl-carrier-protein] ligase
MVGLTQNRFLIRSFLPNILLNFLVLSIGFSTANSGAQVLETTQTNLCQRALKKTLLKVGKQVLGLRYDTVIRGTEVFSGPNRGVLVLANHPGFADPPILMTELAPYIDLRPVMKENVVQNPILRATAQTIRAITIPDMTQEGREAVKEAQQAIQMIIDALARGENVLLYPSAKIYRGKLESLGNNSGVARILKALPDTRVVLARTRGLWGSSLGFGATGESPRKDLFKKTLPRGILSVLTGGIFFAPKRKVEIDICEPTDFPRLDGKLAMNRYIENFFNENAPPATAVPYYWWQGSEAKIIPDRSNNSPQRLIPAPLATKTTP